MAKTYQNIIEEARVLLQDTVAPHRYDDPVLLPILNRGLQELGRIRPDAFWDTFDQDDIVVPEIATLDLPNNVSFPMMFYGALVYFVTASAELLDDEFVSDGRAMTLMGQFKAQILSL